MVEWSRLLTSDHKPNTTVKSLYLILTLSGKVSRHLSIYDKRGGVPRITSYFVSQLS